jgi:hypothetical protein
MSDHAWILENLGAYLTGGLEPAEHDRLEQHVNECASCAAVLGNTRALDVTLTSLFIDARPSAALEDRVIQTLRTRPSDPWNLQLPAWLAIAAAALVLIGFTGAVASQILVQASLLTRTEVSEASPAKSSFMGGAIAGEIGGSERGGDAKNVDQLAKETREGMLSYLPSDWGVVEEGWGDWNVRRYTDNTSNRVHSSELLGGRGTLGGEERSAGKLQPHHRVSPPPSVPPSSTPPSSVVMGDGSVRALQAGLPPVSPDLNTIAGLASAANGKQPFYFAPSNQLADQPAVKVPKDSEGLGGKPTKETKGSGERKGGPGEETKSSEQDKEGIKVKRAPQPSKQPPLEQPGPRKIVIRTGEVEYEVQSFDAAVATITRLLKNINGGFIATVNSDKLANGKVRGSVVVRVPPENLDELILELRTNLGKSSELKNQRIGSLDITKQYTDLESELRAARAMEERLLQIIKTGKGEIKDLLAAEKELGNWRTRIEKIEGELRYYANQVALSTLTITLYEKEIQAPFGIVEREQVQMGIEVEDVDQAYQAAQKAVREAKGRITRAEMQQPFQGQFSARLDFEVSPDAAGLLRDHLKQLGTVARFDISRLEETEGGTGKPSDGKTRRNDTRFQVHLYNLTNVAPRETVQINLASADVEASLKTLLARIEKADGRVVASNLNSARGNQAQADLQFEVKTTLADAVLADVKAVGEVMRLNVTESTDRQNTTPKKRGFRVQLLALSAAAARETDEIQLACTDVPASYRALQEAVLKAKGRVRNAQLNEQDRRNVTATLDFEIRRVDEDVLRAALTSAGDIYTRKANHAADADNIVDSKVHWLVTFINQANIPPRETYVFGVEVADVDRTAAMLSALVRDRQGSIVKADIARERTGRVTGKLIYDVALGKVHELLDAIKSAGTVRVQQSVKHPEVPDSPLSISRLDVTLSNQELIVPSDDGLGASIRRGLTDSVAVLSWSVRLLILGLCVLLPWALVVWALYRLIVRLRRRNTPPAPAT